MRPVHLLDDLAERIGENRIIAGIHFPKDHEVGKRVADWCHTELLAKLPTKLPMFQKLVGAATTELANEWEDQP